jgi:hypothetical protein
MDKQFETIAQEAMEDEMKKIADYYDDMFTSYPEVEEETENEEPVYSQEESYEDQKPNFLSNLLQGVGTGSALMSGFGAMGNNAMGNPILRNLARNAIVGGLIGGVSVGGPLLIKHFTNPSEKSEDNIAAQPIDSIIED